MTAPVDRRDSTFDELVAEYLRQLDDARGTAGLQAWLELDEERVLDALADKQRGRESSTGRRAWLYALWLFWRHGGYLDSVDEWRTTK